MYKQLELQFENNKDTGIISISYDEKPGIQAIANTMDDLRPTMEHGFIGRDSEYKRLGSFTSCWDGFNNR